jgi:hypothetical protein
MKKFTAILSALVLFAGLSVLVLPGAAAPPAHSAPTRANQGHPPPPPTPRAGPQANQRSDAERQITGHVNDTQHVNHDQWYGHAAANDPRFHLDHPFAAGHFAKVGADNRFGITRIDAGSHRFWFRGGGYFTVADWDWVTFSDWCWNCGDDFVVYEDPDHPGWYLLYDTETGVYLHVQYDGM